MYGARGKRRPEGVAAAGSVEDLGFTCLEIQNVPDLSPTKCAPI